MSKHTPGPWSAVNWTCHAPTTIKSADGTVVADTSGFGRHADDCIPDALLIAAAPDAIDALNCAPVHRLDETPESFIERYKVWYRNTRHTAIAKATGGQS